MLHAMTSQEQCENTPYAKKGKTGASRVNLPVVSFIRMEDNYSHLQLRDQEVKV
jgi:hypothetical protein